MEQIGKLLPSILEQNSLKKSSDSVGQCDNQIIKVKYASMRFKHYAKADISRVTPDILHRVSAITGWALPIGSMLNALLIELEIFISENCQDINLDELLFSVRNYSKYVKEWGKVLNLNLISEVIDLYLADRFEQSRLEENGGVHKQVNYSMQELINFQRADIEFFYQRMRSGSIEPIPDYFEPVLKMDKLMKDETIEEFFINRLNMQYLNIYIKE